MRRAAGLLTTALLAAGLLAGCGEDGNWTRNCETVQGLITCAPDQRPQVTDVTGELLAGGTYDVAQDRGKVVVVNFWGSWCNPCRAEADDLENAFQATRDKGVSFVGVNTRDDKDAAIAFERAFGVTYPSIFDPNGEVAVKFDVTQVTTPSTLILDRQGRIAAAMRRATVLGELQPLVDRIASETRPTTPPTTRDSTKGPT